MIKHNSDFPYEREFREYLKRNRIRETMFLTEAEAECLAAPADRKKNTHTQSSEKEIIFALGFICTLVVLSVFQLYRSVEVTPANPKIANLRELSASNTEKIIKRSSRKENEAIQKKYLFQKIKQ